MNHMQRFGFAEVRALCLLKFASRYCDITHNPVASFCNMFFHRMSKAGPNQFVVQPLSPRKLSHKTWNSRSKQLRRRQARPAGKDDAPICSISFHCDSFDWQT